MDRQAGTTDRFNFKCPPPIPGKKEKVDVADLCDAISDVIVWLTDIRDVLCASTTKQITVVARDRGVQPAAKKKTKKKAPGRKATTPRKSTRK